MRTTLRVFLVLVLLGSSLALSAADSKDIESSPQAEGVPRLG